MASSKSVVIAALIANGAIAVLKFVGYLLTNSPSMLSETYHSVSDTGNQVFLLFGIRFSSREASDRHPFGYGKAQFFYSFLVSMLLFGIAGWESAKHGYAKIQAALGESGSGAAEGAGTGHETLVEVGFPVGYLQDAFGELGLVAAEGAGSEQATLLGVTVPSVYVNYGVLIGAFVFESYALYKANQGMRRQMEEYGWDSYREAFRKTSDSTTLTAFTEDTVALIGILLALVGVFLTEQTGNEIYDAVTALLIGVLLMGFALALAWENKRLLIGEGFPEARRQELQDHVAKQDGVAEVIDLRTVYFGPEKVLVTADIAFDEDLDTAELDDRITAIEETMAEFDSNVGKVYIEPET
jgi:divalent metal cation (Fe/Co/Zn/Cd) transporter